MVPSWSSGLRSEQGRRDSNPQPPVLETGALPIELLPSGRAGAGSASLAAEVAGSSCRESDPVAEAVGRFTGAGSAGEQAATGAGGHDRRGRGAGDGGPTERGTGQREPSAR